MNTSDEKHSILWCLFPQKSNSTSSSHSQTFSCHLKKQKKRLFSIVWFLFFLLYILNKINHSLVAITGSLVTWSRGRKVTWSPGYLVRMQELSNNVNHLYVSLVPLHDTRHQSRGTTKEEDTAVDDVETRQIESRRRRTLIDTEWLSHISRVVSTFLTCLKF